MTTIQAGRTSLFTKLAKILGEIGRVAKNGRNDHHGYDYVTESDLVEAVRAKLASNNIAYFFSVLSVNTREVETVVQDKGTGGYQRLPAKAGAITEVVVQATFADGDTGESFYVHGAGAGQDAGDKGVYKALTGAQKYILMKTFLIATGDDPEGDSKVDEANAAQAAKPAAKKPVEKTGNTKMAEAVKATEARANGQVTQAEGPPKDDPMNKVLPGGPLKGRQVGSLTKYEAETLLATMPEGNTWTKLVQLRFDYLKQFEKMPEATKEIANELDLDLKPAPKEG